MKRTRHTPEQIIRKLREAERLLASGKGLEEACRSLEISVQTYHRWKAQYQAMRPEEVARLKALEKENKRLKKIVQPNVSKPSDGVTSACWLQLAARAVGSRLRRAAARSAAGAWAKGISAPAIASEVRSTWPRPCADSGAGVVASWTTSSSPLPYTARSPEEGWNAGVWEGANGTMFPHYSTMTGQVQQASDHAAIHADIRCDRTDL
jgi:putative transposase